MLPQIEDLLVLQDRDRRIANLAAQLEKLPSDEARAKTRLKSDTQAVEVARQAILANEVEIKKVELDVSTRKTSITRLKTQQFETRKNDEYTALGHEIERYGRDVDNLETRELELMEVGDSLRTTLKSAEDALAKTQRVVDEELQSIAERFQRVQADLDETRAERQKLAEKTDAEFLHLYERLLKTKNGVAVAPVKNGQCGGCHVRLIPATLIKAQSDKEFAQCENCARILYIEP
ncbi:zinc ribbon domain-containing protein [Haloferula chungangensis]|uniref:Zinc ribbon domain-containing protein n=1 Tax=Haloferula chungangensis TaxID=1048331 RepID=A0ABW2L4Z8_9BACT